MNDSHTERALKDMRNEVDSLASAVQKLQESHLSLKDVPVGARGVRVASLYEQAQEHVETLDEMVSEVEELRNDPDFDVRGSTRGQRATKEVDRLKQMRGRLQEMMKDMEPDVLEADYLRAATRGPGGGDDDEYEDDDGDYSDEYTEPSEDEDDAASVARASGRGGSGSGKGLSASRGSQGGRGGGSGGGGKVEGPLVVEALYKYEAQNNKELSMPTVGELFQVRDTANEDWWLVVPADDPHSRPGYVPRNYVQPIRQGDGSQSDDSELSLSEDDELNKSQSKFKAIKAEAKASSVRRSSADVLKSKGPAAAR